VWASVWTSTQQRTPHLQAGLGQKRCQEGARRHVTLVELSLIGCGHLQLGFLPPSSSGMLCKLSLQSTEGVGYLTIYLPAVLDLSRGAFVDWVPVLPHIEVPRLGFFRDPLDLPDLPTCRRLNVTTNMVADWLGGWKNRNPGCVLNRM
jgi:hypothetical protein